MKKGMGKTVAVNEICLLIEPVLRFRNIFILKSKNSTIEMFFFFPSWRRNTEFVGEPVEAVILNIGLRDSEHDRVRL